MTRYLAPALSASLGAMLIAAAFGLVGPPPRQDAKAFTPLGVYPGEDAPDGQYRADLLIAYQRAGLLTPWPTHNFPTLDPDTTPVPRTFPAGDGELGFNVVLGVSSGSAAFTSYWRSNDDPIVTVFAGREGQSLDPSQGILWVREGDSLRSQQITPALQTGALRITGAEGRTLRILADDGSVFLFNVDNRTLTSLDGQPVPIETPTPATP